MNDKPITHGCKSKLVSSLKRFNFLFHFTMLHKQYDVSIADMRCTNEMKYEIKNFMKQKMLCNLNIFD